MRTFAVWVAGTIVSALVGYALLVVLVLDDPRYADPNELACLLQDDFPKWLAGVAPARPDRPRILVARLKYDDDARRTVGIKASLNALLPSSFDVYQLCEALDQGTDERATALLDHFHASAILWGNVGLDKTISIQALDISGPWQLGRWNRIRTGAGLRSLLPQMLLQKYRSPDNRRAFLDQTPAKQWSLAAHMQWVATASTYKGALLRAFRLDADPAFDDEWAETQIRMDEAAQKELTRISSPREWASLEFDIGENYLNLSSSKQGSGAVFLMNAIDAFRGALEVADVTRDRWVQALAIDRLESALPNFQRLIGDAPRGICSSSRFTLGMGLARLSEHRAGDAKLRNEAIESLTYLMRTQRENRLEELRDICTDQVILPAKAELRRLRGEADR